MSEFKFPARERSMTSARYIKTSLKERGMAIYAMPVLLALLLVLSACSSLSEEECLAADWYGIGVEDGANGQPLTRIGAHRKACAEVGVTPDTEAYSQGRQEGLKSFCTYDRGYAEGKRGASDRRVCPAGELQDAFLDGYDAGREIYMINQEIRGLENQLANVRSELGQIRSELEAGFRIDAAGKKHYLGKYERQAMLDKIVELSKEEERLENQIGGLRASVAGS